MPDSERITPADAFLRDALKARDSERFAGFLGAAPDLFNALVGLEYRDEPGRFCDHAAEPCPRCEAARAAIAKAKGA